MFRPLYNLFEPLLFQGGMISQHITLIMLKTITCCSHLNSLWISCNSHNTKIVHTSSNHPDWCWVNVFWPPFLTKLLESVQTGFVPLALTWLIFWIRLRSRLLEALYTSLMWAWLIQSETSADGFGFMSCWSTQICSSFNCLVVDLRWRWWTWR